MPAIRGVEADVEEIKLKDNYSSNNSRANSIARALKKKISLTRLTSRTSLVTDREERERERRPSRDSRYPTFTIEDWEEGEHNGAFKEDMLFKDDLKGDEKSEGEMDTDPGEDPEGEGTSLVDNEDIRSVSSSKRASQLSVDHSMVRCGRAKFFKRLSVCDLKDGHMMDPKERVFLEAAERGDKHTMMRCLSPPSAVNVNCTDILGRSAIQIAVDNENVEIVELLLLQENVKIGDALLYAITEGVYKIVEMLINHPSITPEMLANDWVKVRAGGEESSDFDPNISPIILAAHCNQFEILQLFLSRGAYIDKPHPLSCSCRQCTECFHADSLRYSLRRIHTYRALASPAWISLTTEDPILAAFRLSWELERLARVENEFKDTYLELSEQCKKYTCELLHQCRSTQEVIAVLNRRSEEDSDNDDDDDDPTQLKLSRLKLALKYDQKQFVAHPNCQQLLTSVWHEGLPIWRRRNAVVKILLCFSIIVCMPLIAIIYLIFPRTRLGRVIRSPFMKFIYHSASFGLFLVLLVLASTRTEGSERHRRNVRGPAPTFVEWLIFFWVTGMVWAECKQLWEEGLTAYIRQWWNWLDFIMLSLYLCTFSLRAVAFVQITTNKYGPREVPRAQWPANDPTLIAEGVFAVANVFSFARIIYLFQTNPHLGPLQISLGCMIIDIAKFLFIFFLVLTSFACGLNQLYWYYDSPAASCNSTSVDYACHTGSDAFNTLDVTFATLFWSLFGISSPKSTDLEEEHVFIETVGQGLFMAYHVMSIIVLINMLIAMMSNSFQQIEDHADQEWKFARSKLWMSYFDPGSTLPAPFNLIISPKAVFYLMRNVKNCMQFICFRRGRTRRDKRNFSMEKGALQVSPSTCRSYLHFFFTAGPLPTRPSKHSRYAEVMRRLVSRYIHQTKKQHRQDGVNEDDLLEIKQDISSLRYELREDRKRETARAYGQMDSIKKDILRLLKQSGRMGGRGGGGGGREAECGGAGGGSSGNPVVMTTPAPCPACSQTQGVEPGLSSGASGLGMLQQHSVDLGMLGRDASASLAAAVDITVTPASSLPCNLTYSQGNLTGCLLAPQEMDYLRKEIVSSLRNELREMLRDALTRALTPTTTMTSHTYYSPTSTPTPTPQFVTTPTALAPHMTSSQFSLPAPPCQTSTSCGLSSPTTAAAPQLLVADSGPSGDSCGAQRLNPGAQSIARSPSPVQQVQSSHNSQSQPCTSPTPGASGGVVYRIPQESPAPSKASTVQDILLRPPNESDRIHTHMYTQL
ncbi:transient-receptor-potential-like protein isoform X2 [Eriocheir sinensis]|uniref:transient-receptor-potential-like protein isoform X2 n=1 Tax=Eriocheir sinensis TaxID=95602 RepID=UPI0021C96007|nr:transient-receptor-potential-like protein isoform X2 [Eriocheir sinensis]